MRNYIVILFILALITLTGCDSNAGSVSLKIDETAGEITEETFETIHMNNCGNMAESEQVSERTKEINIEGIVSLGLDGEVVKSEVLAKYGEGSGVLKSQKLTTPKDTNMEFVLKWTEKKWIGSVTVQGKDEQGKYNVSVPISVELVSSNDLGCPHTKTPEENQLPTTQVTNNTQDDPCQWLQDNFPQSSDDAIMIYGLPSNTEINFIYEICPSKANAFSFKANSTVEIQVPSGGCIDSWAGFTQYEGDVGTPIPDNYGGWRVFKGIVRAPEMTIRILGCK